MRNFYELTDKEEHKNWVDETKLKNLSPDHNDYYGFKGRLKLVDHTLPDNFASAVPIKNPSSGFQREEKMIWNDWVWSRWAD